MAGHNTPADDSEKTVKPERQNPVETASLASSYTAGLEGSVASSHTAGRQESWRVRVLLVVKEVW